MAGVDGALIEGNHAKATSLRAFLRVDPGQTCTVRNNGPASLEHSASADGSTPTTIAAAASGTTTTDRWLRSLGQSNITVTNGRIDLLVAAA